MSYLPQKLKLQQIPLVTFSFAYVLCQVTVVHNLLGLTAGWWCRDVSLLHAWFVCLFVCLYKWFYFGQIKKDPFHKNIPTCCYSHFFRPSVNNPAVPDEQVENHNSEESASFLFVVSAPNIICVLMQTSPRTLRVKTDTKDSLRAAPSDLSTCWHDV